jgi:hypothetical protein
MTTSKQDKAAHIGSQSISVTNSQISSIELTNLFLRKEFGESVEINPDKIYVVPTFMIAILRILTRRSTWTVTRSDESFNDVFKRSIG